MKKIFAALMVLVMVIVMSGCNKKIFDTTLSFDKAIISLPNGEVVTGKVQNWTDYEDGDQIQVTISGTVYLVHSSNIALIKEKN